MYPTKGPLPNFGGNQETSILFGALRTALIWAGAEGTENLNIIYCDGRYIHPWIKTKIVLQRDSNSLL